MTEVNVPIGAPVVKNIDGSITSDSSNRLMNGYLDEEGNINTFPGTLNAADLSSISANSQIDGVFWWDDIERLMTVINGFLCVSDDTFSTVSLSSSGPATKLNSGIRPTFATDGTTLFIANGGRIVKSDGSHASNTIYIADSNAPINVTHLIFTDGYLMANKVGFQQFYWADLEDPDTWNALNFATAGGSPDVVVAIHLFRKEIYIFGKFSLEVWENDGETPFAPVDGGLIDTGCIAPYSIVKSDNGVIWFSDKKRFVIYSGGGVDQISTPFDKEFDKLNLVYDCQANRVDIAGRTFFIFTFPLENRSFCYNYTNQNWSEIGYYNTATSVFLKWIGRCHAFSPLWNQHFVGTSFLNSKLYLLSSDYASDDDNPLIMEKITGRLNYGTNNKKRSNKFSISVKRGSVADDSEPKMTLSYNDENRGWSNEIELSLGKKGDTYNMITKHRLGCYRNRQYRLRVSDAVGIAFGDGKEDIFVESR